MKKIGFIEYYLNEGHAIAYPDLIKKYGEGRYEVAYAYAHIESPAGGMTNAEWAEKNGVTLCDTIEEVIEKSDVLMVLSPDNPEMHEFLCDLPLKSGKLVYVDKTCAPDKATAERIFAVADAHGTKCYSSSALRFATELGEIDKSKIFKIYSEGQPPFDIYSIHQIEPVVILMNTPAKRVMATGDIKHPAFTIEFADGRLAQIYQAGWLGFRITLVDEDNQGKVIPIQSPFFDLFIQELIDFFDTGIIKAPHEDTLEVIAIREAAEKACHTPFTWVDVK